VLHGLCKDHAESTCEGATFSANPAVQWYQLRCHALRDAQWAGFLQVLEDVLRNNSEFAAFADKVSSCLPATCLRGLSRAVAPVLILARDLLQTIRELRVGQPDEVLKVATHAVLAAAGQGGARSCIESEMSDQVS
jgi:hypothetical protein